MVTLSGEEQEILYAAKTFSEALDLADQYSDDDPIHDAALEKALALGQSFAQGVEVFDKCGLDTELGRTVFPQVVERATDVREAFQMVAKTELGDEFEKVAFDKVLSLCKTVEDVEIACDCIACDIADAIWKCRHLILQLYIKAAQI